MLAFKHVFQQHRGAEEDTVALGAQVYKGTSKRGFDPDKWRNPVGFDGVMYI